VQPDAAEQRQQRLEADMRRRKQQEETVAPEMQGADLADGNPVPEPRGDDDLDPKREEDRPAEPELHGREPARATAEGDCESDPENDAGQEEHLGDRLQTPPRPFAPADRKLLDELGAAASQSLFDMAGDRPGKEEECVARDRVAGAN